MHVVSTREGDFLILHLLGFQEPNYCKDRKKEKLQ